MSVRVPKTKQDFNPFSIIHPIRPKTYKSAYLCFVTTQFKAITRQEFLDLPVKERIRLLGQLWRDLNEQSKVPYKE